MLKRTQKDVYFIFNKYVTLAQLQIIDQFIFSSSQIRTITGEKRSTYRPNHNLLTHLPHKATSRTQQQILYEHHEYEEVRAALEPVLLSS